MLIIQTMPKACKDTDKWNKHFGCTLIYQDALRDDVIDYFWATLID